MTGKISQINLIYPHESHKYQQRLPVTEFEVIQFDKIDFIISGMVLSDSNADPAREASSFIGQVSIFDYPGVYPILLLFHGRI